MKYDDKSQLFIIEATDLYFDEVYSKWFPVPRFWIGDYVQNHSHRIQSNPVERGAA